MGCASTTPMLVDGPANGILKSLESGAGSVASSVLHKVEEEVGSAASRIAKHASQEVTRVMSTSKLPSSSDMEPDIAKAMEGVEEEIKHYEAKLALMERALTPAIDEATAGIMEEEMPAHVAAEDTDLDEPAIDAALAELEENLPPAKLEPMDTSDKDDEIPEIESEYMPETVREMVAETLPETSGEIEGEEEDPETLTQEIAEVGMDTPKICSPPPEDPEPPSVTPEVSEEGQLQVPMSGDDADSDGGSELDFHMSLEDMEILEAQLRALTTPPPLGNINEQEEGKGEEEKEEERKEEEDQEKEEKGKEEEDQEKDEEEKVGETSTEEKEGKVEEIIAGEGLKIITEE